MRPLRVLFVANDGLSAGHVVRMLAIAGELGRRSLPTQRVLATTSQAHGLLAAHAADGPAVVQLPAVAVARGAGLDDATRRRVVRGALDGVIEAFAPDLVVADTFPTGPHEELALVGRYRKALVRRATANVEDALLVRGLDTYDLAVTCEDGVAPLPVPTAQVPPITLFEPAVTLDRAEARARLGLPADAEIFLVTAGGGGDLDAAATAERIARAIAPAIAVVTTGPLTPPARRKSEASVRRITAAPLQPYLAAFDGAFATAGYNTAHELAKAHVPTVLWSRPRPFDDQAARAARFDARGWARATDDVAAGLAFLRAPTPPVTGIELGGAARAVDALLGLVGA